MKKGDHCFFHRLWDDFGDYLVKKFVLLAKLPHHQLNSRISFDISSEDPGALSFFVSLIDTSTSQDVISGNSEISGDVLTLKY